jgi:hypothetical protein
MGNYFSISSSETKESIKIINEIDHVHVIASSSSEDGMHLNHQNENEIASNYFLNEQTQTEIQVQTETESNVDVDVAGKQTQTQIDVSDDCVVYKKTNMKKKKCKKNKKHLQ